MATIDSTIYGQIKPLQIESPINALANVTQLKNAQNQNRLFDMKVAESERTLAGENALNDAYRGATGADGTIDRNKLYQSIAQGGQGAKLPGIQKNFTDMDKSGFDSKKAQIETSLKTLDIVSQSLAPTLQNPALYPQVRAALMQQYPEGAANLPEQFDPNLVKSTIDKALTTKDRAEQDWKKMEFAYRQQNDAANREVTIGGQDKVDRRARDLNATKVEENNLKREAKQETADLTKNSQLASFDTMLGTLDRLGKHKGLTKSVGLYSKFPTTPGSDSANFQAELNTFQSQAFLPMVAQLKGMGALSDAEGKKLTAAVGALDLSMSEDAFKASVKRITDDMNAARGRMVGKPTNGGSAPDIKNVDVGGKSMDARKAPNGKYYVQQGNGKWAEVVE